MKLLFFSSSRGSCPVPEVLYQLCLVLLSFKLATHHLPKTVASFYIVYLQHNLLVSGFQKRKMVCLFLCFHLNIHSITFKVTGGLLLDEVCFLLLINGSTSGSIISVTCQLGFLSSVLLPFFIIVVAAFTGFQIVGWEISGTPLLTLG